LYEHGNENTHFRAKERRGSLARVWEKMKKFEDDLVKHIENDIATQH